MYSLLFSDWMMVLYLTVFILSTSVTALRWHNWFTWLSLPALGLLLVYYFDIALDPTFPEALPRLPEVQMLLRPALISLILLYTIYWWRDLIGWLLLEARCQIIQRAVDWLQHFSAQVRSIWR